ncbi:hypothetical protein ACFQ3W_07270 [Paenibacillus puldeungensis]|uniref:Uncharacterized protein n=1 Tax=Paenibacillus puldeungensis TaxID=696536 RepID=A0ABW3RV13_9BACL
MAVGDAFNLDDIVASDVIFGHEIVRIAQQACGTKKMVLPLGRVGLSILGLFVPAMKEEPLRLSGDKYGKYIGKIPATKHAEAIAATICELQKNR